MDNHNGIPIWVTQYDAHDTKDNAELCDLVLAIESLDKHETDKTEVITKM